MHRPILRGLRQSVVDKTPRDHRASAADLRRRQLVCVVVVLVGAATLGWSLRIEPGRLWFDPATFTLAAGWAIGAFASGNLHLGRIGTERARRPVWPPVLVGLALSAVFLAGAFVVREILWLAERVRDVLDYADQGSLALLVVFTAVNGIAEELFFRGALYAAIPRHPVLWTTLGYGLATAATGNPMLAFAALMLGVVVGLERRATGGVLAPILTHMTWSLSMLFLLPMHLARRHRVPQVSDAQPGRGEPGCVRLPTGCGRHGKCRCPEHGTPSRPGSRRAQLSLRRLRRRCRSGVVAPGVVAVIRRTTAGTHG